MTRLLAALLALNLGIVPCVAETITTTPSGSGGGGGSGTVTSIATGCQATGGTITTTGTISTSETVNLQSGSNYAIVTGDCGKLVQLSNAGAQTPTIAAAGSAGFAAGWFTDVVNTGAGTQTIAPATSTINGAATYALAQNQGVRIVSDGANYQVQPGNGASPGGSSGQIQTNNGSGAFGAVAAPSGAVVGTTDSQTLTNKSIAASEVNSGTLAAAQMPAFTGDCTTVAGAVATTCNIQPHPGYLNNNYYLPWGTGALVGAGSAQTTNSIKCTFGSVNQAIHIATLVVDVTTSSNGNNVGLALYANSAGRPGALIQATAPVALSASTGTYTGAITSAAVGPGTTNGQGLWWCVNSDNAVVILTSPSNTNPFAAGAILGSATAANVFGTANLGTGIVCTTTGCCPGNNCNGTGTATCCAANVWPATLVGATWADVTSTKLNAYMGFQATVP